MKSSKSNFKALVAKMDQLQETEQGKLKGGIGAINGPGDLQPVDTTNYALCGGNGYCPKKTV